MREHKTEVNSRKETHHGKILFMDAYHHFPENWAISACQQCAEARRADWGINVHTCIYIYLFFN